MSFFIGIDLASAHVGVCVLNKKGDLEHLSRKSTSAANYKSKWDRYGVVAGHALTEVLKRQGKVESIFIEGYGGSFKNSLIPAVECGTIMRMLLLKSGLLGLTVDVPPTSLKKFATGNGAAKKENIIAYVYKNYGVMAPDNDQADAYVLAQMARKASWTPEERSSMFAYEKEALKGMKL